jgi:hypothetical protein
MKCYFPGKPFEKAVRDYGFPTFFLSGSEGQFFLLVTPLITATYAFQCVALTSDFAAC